MNVSTVLTRALSAVGKGTVYSSPGKMPPFAASVWPANTRNDCSGFVSWCLRFSENRKVDHPLYKKVNGGWFETTAIYADGTQATGFFQKIADPVPGALLVYPDYKGADGKRRDGHVGIVVDVNGKGIKGASGVIHCSLGNYKSLNDAVQVTNSAVWAARKESVIVWLDGLDPQ